MRTCGECSLCCKLLPMPELEKPAGHRCEHQRALKGCAIYRSRPPSCRAWTCRWLTNDDTADLRRPDRSHYVVDCMPDYVRIRNRQTGEIQEVPILQIWVDPSYPNAHRDPALRAYLERRAAEGFAALVRYDARKAFALWPPALSADGQWHEVNTDSVTEAQHSMRDVFRVLAQTGAARQEPAA